MKFLRVLFLFALGIFLVSNASAMLVYGGWGNGTQQTLSITQGQSIIFNADFFSINPPMTISAILYNSSYITNNGPTSKEITPVPKNNGLVYTFLSTTMNGNGYSSYQPIYNITPSIYLIPGTYQLILMGSDSVNSNSITLSLTVNSIIPPPILDTTPPVITILGSNPATVQIKTSYTDAGATALDNVDGNVAVTTTGTVDINTIGNYTIIYTAKDCSGNIATAKRTVNVVDTIAPTITLNGAASITITRGNPYNELGATVLDNSGEIISPVIDSSAVNTNVVGSYQVTYNAVDLSGNHAATVIRTVNVVSANSNPVISGNQNPETNSGYSYVDVYQNQYLQQSNAINQGINLTEPSTTSNSSVGFAFLLFEILIVLVLLGIIIFVFAKRRFS